LIILTSKMPTTKEDLQHFRRIYESEILEKLLDFVVKQIVSDVKEKAYMTCIGIKNESQTRIPLNSTSYAFEKSELRKHKIFYKILTTDLDSIFKGILPSILEELTKEFPDSKLSTVDNSYILVDWS